MNTSDLVPTRIHFRPGALDDTGTLTQPHGTRALLVTGRSAARHHGYTARALISLQRAEVEAAVFAEITANPTADTVDAAASLARRHTCDVVIGLGGGSAIDAAKAIAVSVATDKPCAALIGRTLDAETPALPVIAIPTTAGSGSEVTKGAIITDTARRFRAGIRGPQLFPREAVIDPDLTATLAVPLAAESVFDAFAHAVEGYLARAATPTSRVLAVEAIGLITANAFALAEGRADEATRRSLSRAALLGGLNVATVSTCLPHRLQQAMGTLPHLHLSHGQGLATLYPAWLRHTESRAPEALDALGDATGIANLHVHTSGVLTAFGLASRLRDTGIKRADLADFVAAVVGNVDNDPADAIDNVYLESIYADAY